MIPTSSLVAMAVVAVAWLVLPWLPLIWLRRRQAVSSFLFGVLTFGASQLLTRIPLLGALQSFGWWRGFVGTLAGGVVLALTAGLFEETGRAVVQSAAMRRQRRLTDAVAFGLGHGGIEAFVLVGLQGLGNLLTAFTVNGGLVQMTPDVRAQTVRALSRPWWEFAAGGLERVPAIAFHVAMSILVLAGLFHRRALRAWVLAVLTHFVLDLAVVGAGVGHWPLLLTELVVWLTGWAAFAVVWVTLRRRLSPDEPPTGRWAEAPDAGDGRAGEGPVLAATPPGGVVA